MRTTAYLCEQCGNLVFTYYVNAEKFPEFKQHRCYNLMCRGNFHHLIHEEIIDGSREMASTVVSRITLKRDTLMNRPSKIEREEQPVKKEGLLEWL